MAQTHQILTFRVKPSSSSSYRKNVTPKSLTTFDYCRPHQLTLTPKFHVFRAISLSSPAFHTHPPLFSSGFRTFCKFNDSDAVSELELGLSFGRHKSEKKVNAINWIILLNLVLYVADHIFMIGDVKALYLIHNRPAWYQFATAAFCHANWNHLYSNLFFLYIFGKLVEAEEGSFALLLSYILTGAGANYVSWLVHPSNSVSVGASGALFGLFAISVFTKVSMDWRRKLEVFLLGQFVIVKVMEAAQISTILSKGFMGNFSLQNVNHTANISGATVGLLWALLVSLSKRSRKALEP